jgi:hypothetical protein
MIIIIHDNSTPIYYTILQFWLCWSIAAVAGWFTVRGEINSSEIYYNFVQFCEFPSATIPIRLECFLPYWKDDV